MDDPRSFPAIDSSSPETDELFQLTYEELRRLARTMLHRERAGQTLQATALVHEAYLKLYGERKKPWANEKHFYLTAAEAMRRILIDNARRKLSRRGGGDLRRTEATLAGVMAQEETAAENVLDVDAALSEFARIDPARAELVKLRFFGGLALPEAAGVLGISEATAKRQWAYAKAWLHDHMRRKNNSGSAEPVRE